MNNVFVYGSLRKGGRWHHLLTEGGATFVTEGALKGFRLLRHDWLPAIEPNTDHTTIGEVYTVSDKLLERLDSLEQSARGWYIKQAAEITTTGTDMNVVAFVYIGGTVLKDHDKWTPIESGDYLQWLSAN